VKILIAEDNRLYRHALEATVSGWGYEAVGVSSGGEAWEVLRQKQPPPLAIVDWMMPGMDGLELCRRVRAVKRANQPYIIILTAKGGKENVIAALQAGADDYIHKPFDLQEMHARLQVGLRIAGLQANLAERVAALERALTEAQRVEALGRLAGGVAHDFNNLLTVINGHCDLLLDDGLAAGPFRERLEVIKQAGVRGAGLTRQLLAFARKQVLNPVVLNLNQCVQGIERVLQPLFGEGIRLVTSLAPDLAPVEADAGQLDQVLLNLLINARDAMPDGGQVRLATYNLEVGDPGPGQADVPPGTYAVLEVSDTGVGMDEATRARIFEPFFTTKGVGKGTGLGLACVYGIVTQSGGFIAVDSAVGRGTTFRIYLPWAVPGAAVPAAPEMGADAPCGGGATVLLVEDEEGVRTLLDSVLTLHGYTVFAAANGPEALRLAAEHAEPIHLLLTDVSMPEMNGWQLAARLAPRRPGMKVLYISGYTDQPGLPPPGEGVPFLAKPFAPDVLVAKVGEVLGRLEPAPV
jgi:two-component system cell cycle sensor histidine kinase/response regulator CckA